MIAGIGVFAADQNTAPRKDRLNGNLIFSVLFQLAAEGEHVL